ncbi:MAG: hypothetical protein KC466_16440 [Myxococcales bacterium]|nr:hypothetical protein [Myxococcales bacterium]
MRATVERRIDGDCDAIATAAVGLGRIGLLVEDYQGDQNLLTGIGEDDGSLVPIPDPAPASAPKALVSLPRRPIALAATLFTSFVEGYFESRSQAAPGQSFEAALECCLFPIPASRYLPDPVDPDERNLFSYLGFRNRAAGPYYCAVPPP